FPGSAGAPRQGPKPEPAPVKTRMFWTWDHSTEWALNRAGAQTGGVSNLYHRGEEGFVQDYTRLLQWCGRHGIDAVVVWGLLRDAHGGVKAAKRLCDVAARQKVRLLCGVGLNAYGGAYFEGDHEFSLKHYLLKHPEFLAIGEDGKPVVPVRIYRSPSHY